MVPPGFELPPDFVPRGGRNLDDPDELTPCDEGWDGEVTTEPRGPATEPRTPHLETRDRERSRPRASETRQRSLGQRPTRTPLLGQGRSVIQPPRPAEALVAGADERTRLGGGPWAPSASLVPRGGVRTLDAWDFVAGAHTVWDAINTVARKVNQVVALTNDRHPHGASALDDAGLYLPPGGPGEQARIPGAFDGTLEHRRNGDGQIQLLVHDGGRVYPHAYDHHRLKVVGTGRRVDDWTLAIAQEGKERLTQLPRLQWKGRARTWLLDGGPLELRSGARVTRARPLDLLGQDGKGYRLAASDEDGDLVLRSLDDVGEEGTERARLTTAGLLAFGGATSLFPALKRDSTTLQFRRADDSGFAGWQAEVGSTIHGDASAGWLFINDTNGGGDAEFIATFTGSRSIAWPDASGTLALQEYVAAGFQPLDAELTALAGLTSAADKLPYFTGSGTAALADFSAFARTLADDADAATARGTLGLGTIATQAASGVAITGGSITGITDLAVADGGTGASTAAAARANLGLGANLGRYGLADALTGTLSETTIRTLTIAAGSLVAGSRVRVLVRGSVAFDASSTTMTATVRVKLGGTTLAAFEVEAAAGAGDTYTFMVEVEVTFASVGAAGEYGGWWRGLQLGDGAPGRDEVEMLTESTKDTTGSLDIVVTGDLTDVDDSLVLASAEAWAENGTA